jgi:SAM-dependent methyltransferase
MYAQPKGLEMNSPGYDELWRTKWGDMQHYGPVHRHTLESLVRTVADLKVKSVLDVGCGSGENLAALAGGGNYELAGVDISKEALALAGSRVPSAKLQQLDVQREILPEKFDLVISIQVVEHIPDDTAAFSNIAKMANRFVLISTMQGRMRPSEPNIGHVRNYSAAELKSKLENAGLEVLDIHGWGFPFYSPLYRSLVEYLPGGPPEGEVSATGKLAARALYQLYKLNWPGRGDVVTALARPRQELQV